MAQSDTRERHGGISIHALREEGDSMWLYTPCWIAEFLSTPSARRATADYGNEKTGQHISIHALREEGDEIDSYLEETKIISIHALREEGDSHLSSCQLTL